MNDIEKQIDDYFNNRIPKEVSLPNRSMGIHLKWSVTHQLWVFGYGTSISTAPSSKDFIGVGKTPSEAIYNFMKLHMLKKENAKLNRKVQSLLS